MAQINTDGNCGFRVVTHFEFEWIAIVAGLGEAGPSFAKPTEDAAGVTDPGYSKMSHLRF